MTPDFRIIANGQDVSAKLGDRLLGLQITEADGDEADSLSITLDDRDGRLDAPPIKSRLAVFLGIRGESLFDMGLFEVEGITGDGPPDRMVIKAEAVDLRDTARAPRTKAHEDRSLRDIAAEIAGRAGLELVLGQSLQGVQFPYVAQTSESDLHFLTRIARDLDATAKASGGKLVVVRRSDPQTAGGDPKQPVTLDRADLTRWSYEISAREKDQAVEAEAQLPATAEKKLIRVGDGTARRLRHVYPSEDRARDAANAALARAKRAEVKIGADCARFMPALFAGGLARFTGLRPEFAGLWHLTQVTHDLGAGLTTSIKAEKGDAT
ncbi:contractile injection system protein, VgrG/Pvc8 family [Roseinatronobacter sp.]|uniref:contractile injection system protein, VgrG/Pvc8 family n=1 Tax=Roseinatronobacter sp. TaxID=1945755 RepID=UPI0025D477A1|nr:contractile injection system protein, VgrG/Pvc8 family [Roseibaca sp.]